MAATNAEYNNVIQKGRLLYFDPANYIGYGKGKDNEVYRLEDYNVYVDLSVIIPTRDGGSLEKGVQLGSKKISIVNGVNGQLTDSFINASYSEIKGQNISNAENLGIESIQIAIDSHMYPQVTIKFIDVRGFSLMMPSMMQNNDSSYTALFNSIFKFPYPRFELTVKGFYGTPVVYDLAVNEFTSSLNSSTGNYEMTVTFIGYPFGILSDIPMNLIMAAPYIESDNDANTLGYWANACETRLRYTDKGDSDNPEVSGMELMTFVDYIKATNDINDKIKENGDANAVNEFNASADKQGKISGFVGRYEDFIKALSKVKNYSESNHVYTLPYDLSKEKEEITEEIKGACIKIKEEYPSEWKECPFSELFIEEKNTTKIKEATAIHNLVEVNALFTEVNETTFSVTCTDFEESIKEKEDKTEEEVNNAREELDKKMPEILKRALGFEPFVLNYFRMAYGHLDTFFHYFYETINNIIDNKSTRIPKDMGLNHENSDLSKKTDLDNGFVPPFPAVYNKEGKLIYPGSDPTLYNMEEVKLVEKLLSAALKTKRKTNEYILAAANKREENASAGTLNFIPSSLFDIFWGDKNPYTMVRNLEDAYYLFAIRTMVSRLTIEGGNNAAYMNPVAIEAYNYFLANPNPSKEVKTQIEHIVKHEFESRAINTEETDICAYLRLEGDDGYKKGQKYVTKISCADEGSRPVCADYLAFFYNNIYSQLAKDGNTMYLNSSLPINITDFEGYKPLGVYIIDNSETSSGLRASIEAIKGGISGAETQAENTFTERASYERRKTTGDPNATVDVSDNHFVENMRSVTNSLYNTITTEKGEAFYKFLENKKDKDKRINENTCCYPTDIVTDGNTKRPRKRWKANSDGANVSGNMIEGEYLTWEILKKIDDNIDAYAIPRNASIVNNVIKDLGKFSKTPKDKGQAVVLSACIEGEYIRSSFEKISTKNNISIVPKIAVLYLGLFGDGGKQISKLTTLSAKQYTDEWVKSTECERLFNLIKNSGDGLLNAEAGNTLLKFYFEPCYLFYGLKRTAVDTTGTDEKNVHGTAITQKFWKEGNITEYLFAKALFYNFFSNLARLYGLLSGEEGDKEKEAQRAASEKDKEVSALLSDDYRLSIYLTLKKIYDKWCPSYSPEEFILPSPERGFEIEQINMLITDEHKDNFFSDTLYVDSMFNRIGTDLEINPRHVYDIIKAQFEGTINFSFLEFISQMCQRNKMLFFSVPQKIPFSSNEVSVMFMPNPITEPAKKRTTYIAMYPHDVSHFVANSDSANWGFDDDGLDLQMVSVDNGPEELTNLFTTDENSTFVYNVPTFAVTYTKQNQSYFNNIAVNMDAPRVTDFSIANVFELGNLNKFGGVGIPQTVAQDMYAIYSNRSYNCNVTMMGCMNIMPMMYFQLNNVPMFRGAYIITRVEHDIRNNHVSTTFMGTRVSKYLMPYNKDVFNFNLFKDFFGVRMATAVPQNKIVDAVGGVGYSGQTNLSLNIDEKIRKNQKIPEGRTPPEELVKAINSASSTHGIPKIYFYMMSFLESGWKNAKANSDGYGGYFGTRDLSLSGAIQKSVDLYKDAQKRNNKWNFTEDAFLVYAYMVHNSGPAGADYQLSLTQGKIENISLETTAAYANHFFPKLSATKKNSIAAEKYAAPKKAFYVLQQLKDGRFSNLIN